MYLLDTNVISAVRKGERSPRAWLEAQRAQPMYLSVVTIGEIERGIETLAQRGETDRVAELRQGLRQVLLTFADRVLPVDIRISQIWGKLTAGPTAPLADALIAATAESHDLILATRNVRDFERFEGVRIVNPWMNPAR